MREFCLPDGPVGIPPVGEMRRVCARLLPQDEAARFALAVQPRSSTRQAALAALDQLFPALPADQMDTIRHDGRRAPVAVLPPTLPKTLISLTDEGGWAGALAAVPAHGADLAGIGLDLASVEDFPLDGHAPSLYAHLFTPRERALLEEYSPSARPCAAAALFAAKESAIKCTAPLIRRLEPASMAAIRAPRFSQLEVRLKQGCGPVVFSGQARRDAQLLGLRAVQVVCLIGGRISFAAAKCMI